MSFSVIISSNIRDALSAINENNVGSVAVVNKVNTFLGFVTDGDIRRFLISGGDVFSPISEVMNTSPTVAQKNKTKCEIERLVQINDLVSIPILDGKKFHTILKRGSIVSNKPKNISVLIMAGGLGLRLRPLTLDTPKPMLPVKGVPLLEIIILQLKDFGFLDIHISVRYKHEDIVNYFSDGSDFGVRINYVYEDEPLGTIGSVSNLKDNKFDNLLIVNGDVLTDLDFEYFNDFHVKAESDFTVVTKRNEHNLAYGVLSIDSENNVYEVTEKPTYNFYISTGIYLLSKRAINLVKGKLDAPELIEKCCRCNLIVKAYSSECYWLDIGTLADYDHINNPGVSLGENISRYTC